MFVGRARSVADVTWSHEEVAKGGVGGLGSPPWSFGRISELALPFIVSLWIGPVLYTHAYKCIYVYIHKQTYICIDI